MNNRNTFILLYQPLRIESQAFLRTDAVFNDITFPASTGINCLYNFPFYRFSYLRELMPDNPKYKFAIGGTLQNVMQQYHLNRQMAHASRPMEELDLFLH